jgi:hypothetical protein
MIVNGIPIWSVGTVMSAYGKRAELDEKLKFSSSLLSWPFISSEKEARRKDDGRRDCEQLMQQSAKEPYRRDDLSFWLQNGCI